MGRELKNWSLLILLSGIWGSSFILMKKAMFSDEGDSIFNDTQVASIRMLVASLILLPFAIKGLRKIKERKKWLSLIIVGFSGNFFPAFLFTYAETGLSSGYTGMLNSFTPIFALLIGFIIFKSKLTLIQAFGVTLGTVGIIMLSMTGDDLATTGNISHVLAVIGATLCYAISINTIKYTLKGMSGIEITSIAFSTILIPSLIISLTSNSYEVILSNPNASEGLVYIGVLSVVGTSFAVILFNVLIANSSIIFSSSVTYLIPIFAVLIGISFGENISAMQIASMGIVLGGVFLSNFGTLLKKKSAS